ncbi:MAG: PTS sugar transporter subunit IIA [Proteobacteria bacterium]|jgi:nitrogen PTS system EIIA component|nr:PTS sugar transporter subunit IIA [Pseudomonadota bacterium]
MQLSDFLSVDRIVCDLDIQSKKRALEQLSELIAQDQDSISAPEIFDSLLSRERLGGTGIGFGVAIPHGRLKNSEHTTAALIQLKHGVDFDAIDNQPVDLLFALVVPEQATDDHLKILALLAGMFQDAAMRNKLRECHNPETMLKLIREWQPGH